MLFSNRIARFLVIPDPEKDWLAQAIVPRPFGKLHFTNHRRFNPNAPFHFGDG